MAPKTAKDSVIESVKHVFNVDQPDIENLLEIDASARVRGVVIVKNSQAFEAETDSVRTKKVWDYLRKHYKPMATKVGRDPAS